jgi:hypothetical protein
MERHTSSFWVVNGRLNAYNYLITGLQNGVLMAVAFLIFI